MSEHFRLTRKQARGLAEALRATSWKSEIGGDHTISLENSNGDTVVVVVSSARPTQPKVIKGFTMERK